MLFDKQSIYFSNWEEFCLAVENIFLQIYIWSNSQVSRELNLHKLLVEVWVWVKAKAESGHLWR